MLISPIQVLFVSWFPLLHRSPLFPYTTLFRSLKPGETFDVDSGGLLCRLGWQCALNARSRRRLSLRDRSSRPLCGGHHEGDRKSTRLNSSHTVISYAVFCLKKKRSRRHELHKR